MKKIILTVLAVFIAGSAYAGYKWTGKKVDTTVLQQELIAAGCTVKHITTAGTNGVVHGPNCAAAAGIVTAHDAMGRVNKRSTDKGRVVVLRDKAKARTITDAERDELLGILADMALGE